MKLGGNAEACFMVFTIELEISIVVPGALLEDVPAEGVAGSEIYTDCREVMICFRLI